MVRSQEERTGLDGRHRAPGREGFADRPLVVTWEVTQACELACRHCRADARPERDPRELSTAEGRELLEDLLGFGEPYPVVVFTGGDPLKRPDLVELARYGTELGLTTAVTPATTPLLDRERLAELADAGIRRVALSLDGATAGRHDAFRGEAGSFAIAMRAAGQAREMEIPIQINTTVARSTAADLPELARIVEETGAVMWEVFFLVPVGRGRALEPLTPGQHERVLRWLYLRSRRAPYRIITVEAPFYRRVGRQIEAEERQAARELGLPPSASGGRFPGSTGDGNGFLFVSHAGDVFPSGFLPVAAGNVRRDDVVEVYRHSPVFRRLRDRERLKGKCGACEFRFACGGSRARTMAVFGDWMREDPFCPYVPDGWEGASVRAGGGDPVPGRLPGGVLPQAR